MIDGAGSRVTLRSSRHEVPAFRGAGLRPRARKIRRTVASLRW